MGIKKLIRTIVVRTNPIPPFTRLNRIPYALAIKEIERLATTFPGIRSVYLRHGLTRADWEPGLSDIDFTVVLSRGLSQKEELELVREFMSSYHSLARWLPILGEVEIFNETCCDAWSRFSIRGAEAGDWRLLYGADIVTSSYVQNDTRLRKDSLDHACWIYESYVLRQFLTGDSATWIDLKALERVARKALRYARDKSGPETGEQLPVRNDAAAIVLHVLEQLDAQVKDALQRSTQEPAVPGRSIRVLDEADRPGYSATKFVGLREYDSIILAVVLSFSTSFIVLKDGISLSALVDDLNGIGEVCRAQGIQPTVVTRSLFQYYLQSYRPQVFLELREYRHILFGVDLLREVTGPNTQYLAGDLLNQSLNAMLAPARHASDCTSSVQNKEWVRHAWRSAFLLLYLDAGIIGSHERSMEACREQYPELCNEISQLSESRDNSEKLAYAVHALLRRCALDINRKIGSLDPGRLPSAEIIAL